MFLYNQLRQIQQTPLYSVESYEPIEPPEEKTPNYHYIKTGVSNKTPLLNRVNLNLLNLQNIAQAPIIKKINFDLCFTNNNNNAFNGNNLGNLYACNNLITNNHHNLLSPGKTAGNINRDIDNNNSFNYGNNVKIPLYNFVQPQAKLSKSKSSKYFSPIKQPQIVHQKNINNNKIILPNKIRQLSPPGFAKNHNLNSNKKIIPIYRKIVYRRRHLFEN